MTIARAKEAADLQTKQMEVNTRQRHKSTLSPNTVPVIHETVIKLHSASPVQTNEKL